MAPLFRSAVKSPPDGPLPSEVFRRRYLLLVLATWTLPVVVGASFEVFMGLVRAEEVLLTIFAGFTGPFVAGFLIFATIALDRGGRRIIGLVGELPEHPEFEPRIHRAARRLIAVHIGLFLFYCIVGPQTTLLSNHFLYADRHWPTAWHDLLIGMLPPILLIALPLFFLATDVIGRYLAPRGVMFNLASLRLKYVVLGLVTPALIDITLLLYFHARTDFFRAETMAVWLVLLFTAGLGTALAWRSLSQSVAPLHSITLQHPGGGTGPAKRTVVPQSLDELGRLAVDWNRAAEAELRQEARYRDLVEGSIQGIFIVQNMRIVFANSAFARMMGYGSVEEVLALTDALVFVAPEDRERILEYSLARREGREAPDRYEMRAVRADGGIVWQEVIARPVLWDGAPALQITVIDITERKQAEQSLRENELRFRDLVEGSIQGVLVHRHHEILFANRAMAEILRYDTAEEVVDLKDVLKFVHEDDRERLIGYRRQRMAGAEVPNRYEFRVVAKDGATIWVENIARLVEWDGQKAIQSTFVDITERKRAEESLRDSEARFRDLIEGSIQGIFVHRDFRILFANQAMADILGYDNPEALLAMGSVLEFIPESDHAGAMEIKNARLAGKAIPDRYELRALRRDGSVVWLENIARVVNWGGEQAIQATVVDITERKLTEEALRHSQDGLVNAQRIAKLGSWDWDINNGTLHWSDEIYHIFGVEPGAFPATYDSFLGYIHPDDRSSVEKAVERALRGKAPYSIDHRILLADGTLKVVHEQGEVFHDESGQPVRMSGTVQDISELRRTESALRQSEESLRQAQRMARMGNWERDLISGELRWSDEMFRLFGLEAGAAEPSYDLFMRYVHPSDRAALRNSIQQSLADGAPYDIDFRIVRPCGGEIVVHAQGEIEQASEGRPTYFRGTAQDVTKLRQAEAEVRRLNEQLEVRVEQRTRELHEAQAELIKKDRLATLGQLTATVSHELRNPLGAMRTSAYVLTKSLPPDSDGALRAAARIERGIERCDRIIDELLDFTRSAMIDREPVAVDRWLAGVLREQTIPEGIAVETEFGLAKRTAMIDPGRMRRAIINLVENACQAITGQPGWDGSAANGRIVVSSVHSGGDIEIRIADNGPGIPQDQREKIFEPLFSTKNFGVGLGLPTVLQILEQHGGRVVVDSSPGAGTLFRLIFPLVEIAHDLPPAGGAMPAEISET